MLPVEDGSQRSIPMTPERWRLWLRLAGEKLYIFTRVASEARMAKWPEWTEISQKERDYYSALAEIAIYENPSFELRPDWQKAADRMFIQVTVNREQRKTVWRTRKATTGSTTHPKR